MQNPWAYRDSLSVTDASFLLAGVEPAVGVDFDYARGNSVPGWSTAVSWKAMLEEAIKMQHLQCVDGCAFAVQEDKAPLRDLVTGSVFKDESPEYVSQGSLEIDDLIIPESTYIVRSSLIAWCQEKNIDASAFTSRKEYLDQDDPYGDVEVHQQIAALLSGDHQFTSIELRIALKAWIGLSKLYQDAPGKLPPVKASVLEWYQDNVEFEGEEGKDSVLQDRIATIVNWEVKSNHPKKLLKLP
jgi:hypothetical protein